MQKLTKGCWKTAEKKRATNEPFGAATHNSTCATVHVGPRAHCHIKKVKSPLQTTRLKKKMPPPLFPHHEKDSSQQVTFQRDAHHISEKLKLQTFLQSFFMWWAIFWLCQKETSLTLSLDYYYLLFVMMAFSFLHFTIISSMRRS